MRIVLIRHGERKQTYSGDGQTSLSCEGREQVEQLRRDLTRLKIHPTLILTSQHAHARETAQILAAASGENPEVPVISLKTLTSPGKGETPPPGKIEQIADEALDSHSDLHGIDEVAFVGHEPYVGQLVTRLTGVRCRPLQRCELVCLRAPSFTKFLKGKGEVEFRYPVNDFQEEALREKVQSKMSVSTFLAGFAFTALTLLLAPGGAASFSVWQMASIVCLTASLVLFVASVYIYDRLSMPPGFWAYDDRGGPPVFRFGRAQFDENAKYHGILYALMIWNWQYVFTPAVVIGLVGFVALLIDTDNWVVVSGGAIAIAVGFAYYWLERPRLGVD